MIGSSSLNATRRADDLARLGDNPLIDVLVIGGGITGAGVALDAASRGLRTVLVERHDLAFGTSRFSSKLVHGGLRYLASGRVGIAHESAVERGILLAHTAGHLVRALPQVVPATPAVGRLDRVLVRAGFAVGDLLRRSAGTPARLLPRSRRITPAEVVHLAPTVARAHLRGGYLAWDGQLVDDARLVITVARTAAAHGATILTRVEARHVHGDAVTLVDRLTEEQLTVTPRAVINAAGVWAGTVDSSVRLRPSRGTHLVFDASVFGGLHAALTVPVPNSIGRFVFALPAAHDRVYLGLTDEPVTGPIPDIAQPSTAEIDFLLATINQVLYTPLTHRDVRGSFAGLRPLLDSGDGSTADLSREHAILQPDSGIITVAGGKLTTYRAMARDAVDTAITDRRLPARPCHTRHLPLVGATGADAAASPLLVHRYGSDAVDVLAAAAHRPELLRPVAPGSDVIAAEFVFAMANELALDVEDLLDRRTRIGLVATDRDAALPAAHDAVETAG